jgi:membrane protease YdiL (CAAX protease family)
MKTVRQISIFQAIVIFSMATIYFYTLSIALFPFLKSHFQINSSLYWFITGYFLFIPLFIYAVLQVRSEGNRSAQGIMKALGICSMQKKDWYYVIGGALLIFLLTGLIFGISVLLHEQLGWRLLTTNPVFMEGMKPYVGWEKLYLFVWLPMFFFNIVGEEILWRGFIQRRMASKYAWIICGFLWAIFHLPFGIDLIIMAAPALLIIPYIFSKTQSTSVAIAIHGIYNGPIFVLISLGVIGI